MTGDLPGHGTDESEARQAVLAGHSLGGYASQEAGGPIKSPEWTFDVRRDDPP